jgi:hydrogenase/urease accessory protein HupE
MRHLDKRAFLFGVCSLLAAFIPSQALAHPVIITSNAFAGRFFHSFTGLDHALAMIGVGILYTGVRLQVEQTQLVRKYA